MFSKVRFDRFSFLFYQQIKLKQFCRYDVLINRYNDIMCSWFHYTFQRTEERAKQRESVTCACTKCSDPAHPNFNLKCLTNKEEIYSSKLWCNSKQNRFKLKLLNDTSQGRWDNETRRTTKSIINNKHYSHSKLNLYFKKSLRSKISIKSAKT